MLESHANMAPSRSSSAVRDMRVAYLKKCAQHELQQGNYGAAADKYSEAATLLTGCSGGGGGTGGSSASDPALLRLLLSNRSLALLRAGRAREAALDAEAVVALAPGWPKGHWRRGKALLELYSCPEAMLSFLQAWQLSEPGSTERGECAQQLLSAVTKLTRQQLADSLLDVLQQQQPDGEGVLAGQAGQLILVADMEPASSRSWQQRQELREALFQLVKAAGCGGASAVGAAGIACEAGSLFADTPSVAAIATRSGCNQYHLLLLKCLVHLQQLHGSSRGCSGNRSNSSGDHSSSSSSTRSPSLRQGDEHAAVLSLQLQLLSARLFVKTKRWTEAQHAAAAAEARLRRLALPHEDQLLQLLVECYLTLGDACFAERPPTAGAANARLHHATASSVVHQQQQQPADAAKAFLTALQLLPPDPVCPFRQLRSQLQGKLAAAMELLDDTQQAVVCAAAAITVGAETAATAAAAGGEAAGSGQQLALIQLGLAQAPQGRHLGCQQPAPLLLATLTLRSSSPLVPRSPGPGAAGPAVTAGLSGADRVLLLSGLARLAGVGRLVVSIAAVVTSSSNSSACEGRVSRDNAQELQQCCLPVVDSITFKVQFAGNSAPTAAAGFAAQCSSIDTLSTGWPELQQVLLPATAVCCSDGGSGSGSEQLLSKVYHIAAVEVADLHSSSGGGGGGGGAGVVQSSIDDDRQCPRQDSHPGLELLPSAACSPHPLQQQQQPPLPLLPADHHMQLAEVACAAASPVIPLPYAHYSLVDEGGAPLERPDKHPFALTRVVYDARDLPCRPVWYQAADATHRWRQSVSEVLVQLLCLPDDVTSAQQLAIELRPYEIRVAHRGTGEVLLSGQLLRGIVPEESTWTFERAADGSHRRLAAMPFAAAMKGRSGSGVAAPTAATAAPPASSSSSSSQITTTALRLLPLAVGKPKLLLQLAKMNLELFESPHQPSASWWPQLFVDDADQLAWDDEAKDYSELPPPLAAAAAAAAAADERQRQEDAQRRAERDHLQELLNRHKRHRCKRIREIKAQLYAKAAAAASAAHASEAGGTSAVSGGSR